MKNVGYPLISFEVKLITIHFKGKDDLVLNPGKHNRLTEYIGKNESLDILVSAVYDVDSNYSLFDEEQIKKGEFTKQKLAETKGKIMNIYLADNANRFDNITITAVTTNIYNYTYHQKIELKETDGVIHTTTILEGEKFIE